MKKILVTGGAGFIGSNFIRYFLKKYSNYKVINLDKLTYAGNLNNLRDIRKNPRYQFIKGGICNKAVVERATKGCDCLINFAAETHVDRSIKQSRSFIRTNIDGIQILLDVVNKSKIAKFIQISTDEVYGSLLKGYAKEDGPLKPSSPYAVSKAAADLLCQSYFITYKTPILIVRSSNNFGEYQFPEKIIPFFVTNILKNKKLPVYGDGMNIRDWIYVRDNCEAIDLLRRKGKIGEIYNVGSDNEKNNIELTRMILNILGKGKDLIEYVEDRPGHDKRYGLNFEKIKQLGWAPRYDFSQALETTVSWYKNNTRWWKPLRKQVR